MTRSHSNVSTLAIILAATLVGGVDRAIAQAPIPPSLVTPDKVETRIGTLEFKDGMPSKATIQPQRGPKLRGVAPEEVPDAARLFSGIWKSLAHEIGGLSQ